MTRPVRITGDGGSRWCETCRRYGEHWTEHHTEASAAPMRCPDGGACHHGCVERCWRVRNAGPLSSAGYPGDQWPEDVRREHSLDPITSGDLVAMLHGADLPLRAVTPHGSFVFDVIGATWEGGHVHLRLLEHATACAPCAMGTCHECIGTTGDTAAERPTTCPCSLLDHPRRTA